MKYQIFQIHRMKMNLVNVEQEPQIGGYPCTAFQLGLNKSGTFCSRKVPQNCLRKALWFIWTPSTSAMTPVDDKMSIDLYDWINTMNNGPKWSRRSGMTILIGTQILKCSWSHQSHQFHSQEERLASCWLSNIHTEDWPLPWQLSRLMTLQDSDSKNRHTPSRHKFLFSKFYDKREYWLTVSISKDKDMDNAHYGWERGSYPQTSPSESLMAWALSLRSQWSLTTPDGTILFCRVGVKQDFHCHLNLMLTMQLMKAASWHDVHNQGGLHPVIPHHYKALWTQSLMKPWQNIHLMTNGEGRLFTHWMGNRDQLCSHGEKVKNFTNVWPLRLTLKPLQSCNCNTLVSGLLTLNKLVCRVYFSNACMNPE